MLFIAEKKEKKTRHEVHICNMYMYIKWRERITII